MKETILNLKRVYHYGKEYKYSLLIQVICCLFGIAFNVVMPLLSAKMIVNFTDSVFSQAILMSLVILIISILNEIKTLIIRKNTQIFRRGTVRNMQMALGREVLKLDQATLDANSSGKFIQRLTNDTDNMAGMFTTGMGKLTGFVSNIGSFVAILLINVHMFIYYLVASIILTILYYVKNEKVGEKDKEFREQSDKVAGLTGELVRGARDIKMLFAKDSFMKKLDSNIREQSELNFAMRNIDMSYNLFIDVVKDIFEFLTVMLLVLLIKGNIISVAVAFALFSYRSTVLTNLMSSVSSLLEEEKSFNISSARVFEIIDGKKLKKEQFGTKHLDNVIGNFEFKDVCFSYDGKKKVLDELNLLIKANKTYGIVGKSGEGKSTILKLISKGYSVNSGKILINNYNINDLSEKTIKNSISVVSQSPYIFNLSIKDNIKLANPTATDEEIIKACKKAQIHDVITSTEKGYDTIVGENGVILSGGQKQRIAIARALIKKSKIILLDEATSSLDNSNQEKIKNVIKELSKDHTVIIVAHRLSTIVNSDNIFVVNNHKICASGTHTELMKNCEEYRNLYEIEEY